MAEVIVVSTEVVAVVVAVDVARVRPGREVIVRVVSLIST